MKDNKLGGLIRTFGQAEIVDVKIFGQGVIVTLRKRSDAMYACNPPRPVPDRIWREIFRYENGELRKVGVQDGIHHPGYFQPEELLFGDERIPGKGSIGCIGNTSTIATGTSA